MIDLTTLAAALEERLNVDVPSCKVNTEYEFHIFTREGDYEKGHRLPNSNTVVKYINAMLSVTSDDKAGISLDSLNIELNTEIDILIPDINAEDAEGNKFKDLIIEHINDCLSLPTQDTVTENGINYLITATYSSVVTGLADMRTQVGESLTASVSIDYSIVAAGISSGDIELYVEGERIYYARLDLARITTMESNISSENSLGIGKTSPQGSSLQIVITKPNRLDALDEKHLDYLLSGINLPFSVRVYHPRKTKNPENNYTVIFSEGSEGAEGFAVPGESITLTEYLAPVEAVEEEENA